MLYRKVTEKAPTIRRTPMNKHLETMGRKNVLLVGRNQPSTRLVGGEGDRDGRNKNKNRAKH